MYPLILLLFSAFFSHAQAGAAAGPSPEELLLTEIRDQLKSSSKTGLPTIPATEHDVIMDKSWGSANLTGNFDPFHSDSENALEKMLNAAPAGGTGSALEKIQFALDAMTYQLFEPLDTSKSSFLSANTGLASSLGIARASDLDNLTRPLSTDLINTYRKTLKASDQIKSCLGYWDAANPDNMPSPTAGKPLSVYEVPSTVVGSFTVPAPAAIGSPPASLPTNVLKVQCLAPEAGSTFNGFNSILATIDASPPFTRTIRAPTATAFSALYDTVNTDLLGAHAASDGRPATACTGATCDETARVANAKSWLEALDGKIDKLAFSLETLIAAEISTTLSPTDSLPSVGALYGKNNIRSPNQPRPARCPAAVSTSLNGIGDNDTNLRTTAQCAQNNSSGDSLINQILGLNGSVSPFRRGLSYTGTAANPQIMVAGNLLTFTRRGSKWVDSNRPPATMRRAGEAYTAVISSEEMSEALTARDSIRRTFEIKRAGFSSELVKDFLIKSGAYDILSGITKLRSNINSYSNGSATFNATPMEALYHNSNWRLKSAGTGQMGANSWINRISTMDNANLLRELLILQAQMLQMQYAIYADQQKGLILSASGLANSSGASELGTQSTQIKGTIQDFLAGVKGMSPHTTAEPTGGGMPGGAAGMPGGAAGMPGGGATAGMPSMPSMPGG